MMDSRSRNEVRQVSLNPEIQRRKEEGKAVAVKILASILLYSCPLGIPPFAGGMIKLLHPNHTPATSNEVTGKKKSCDFAEEK